MSEITVEQIIRFTVECLPRLDRFVEYVEGCAVPSKDMIELAQACSFAAAYIRKHEDARNHP